MSPAIGIDFGTSNTAAAILRDGAARIVPLEPGQETLPTAVFLDYAARRTVFGSAAVRAMIDGQDGRFMRALKSILGTPLAREKRQFLNRPVRVIENEIGHDVAFAVEAGKIGANGAAEAAIDLALVEPGLRPVLTGAELASALRPSARAIRAAIDEVLAMAGLGAAAVGRVIFVGGSSLLSVVEAEVRAALPGAEAERSDVFTAVVRGLALCTADAG